MKAIVIIKGNYHPRDITRLWKEIRVTSKQKTIANGVDATAYTVSGFRKTRFESVEEAIERYIRIMESDERVVVAFPV